MTKSKPLAVSYDRCHELLEICAPSPLRLETESGLKWKVRRKGTRGKGSWAGYLSEEKVKGKLVKYWDVAIEGRLYSASRIIYFMHHGVDPYPLEVDHENRNSLDNNVSNLRLGSRGLQCQNQGMRSDNTSKVKGVHWDKQRSKWMARITLNNKMKNLGRYATLKEAAKARNAAVREYWPEEVWEANLVDLDSIKD